MAHDCVLYDRKCINCGDCDICDLDENKKCDNCGKCIDESGDEFRTLNLEEFIDEIEDKVKFNKSRKNKK